MKHKSVHSDVAIRINAEDSEMAIIQVEGQLSFATVPLAWEQTKSCFNGRREVRVDLAGVERSDSAALALVLEWQRLAKAVGAVLVIQNIPTMLKNIAHVSELDGWLPA